MGVFRIGTRGSELAIRQTSLFIEAAQRVRSDLDFESVTISTDGDRKQALHGPILRDKKDWILDLEKAVLSGQVDLAIHSGKDVPLDIEDGTIVSPVLKRASATDIFVSRAQLVGDAPVEFHQLPKGSKVGTASLRRGAELLRLRPDIEIVSWRGNVPTRLNKLRDRNDIAGIVLASAGLDRLGYGHAMTHDFNIFAVVPAVAQGILAGQFRTDNALASELVASLQHSETALAWSAERMVIERLGADCTSAVGVHAVIRAGKFELLSRVLHHAGVVAIESSAVGLISDGCEALLSAANKVADELIEKGALDLLENHRRTISNARE